MGFIFSGSGFNRRTYAPIESNPRKKAHRKSAKHPDHSSATSSATSSHIAQPVASAQKRPASFDSLIPEHPKKRGKYLQNNVASNSTKHNVPCRKHTPVSPLIRESHTSKTIALVPPGSTSTILHEPEKPLELLDLPPEILLQISCFAGIGKSNQLPHTCSYLHLLCDISQNDHYLGMLIRSNLGFDLLKGTKSRSWLLKFNNKYDSLPGDIKCSPEMRTAFHDPVNAATITRALDSSIFSYPGLESRHVDLIKNISGCIALDRISADRQRKYIRRFLEWKYMVFKKFVALATQSIDFCVKHMLEQAEMLEQCANFKKKHSLEGFEPITESGDVPVSLYKDVTPQKLAVIQRLSILYDMTVSLPALLVTSFFRNRSSFTQEDVVVLFLLNMKVLATDLEVVDALMVYRDLQTLCELLKAESGKELEGESGEEKYFSYAFDRYHDFVIEILSYYFTAHSEELSNEVWDSLSFTKSPGLLNHVLGLGVTVPLYLL